MKRENIIRYVKDPEVLDQSSLREVQQLLGTFPWFQTAHLLLVKNHHNLDSLGFHNALREAAVYTGDRAILYHLVHGLGKGPPGALPGGAEAPETPQDALGTLLHRGHDMKDAIRTG